MIGFTVVGNPAATVITSLPGASGGLPADCASAALSASFGEVSALSATRFADDPEFTSAAARTPKNFANVLSNSAAKRPVVSQKSSEASTRLRTSSAKKTFPETGTGVSPGTKGREGNCSA